MTITIVISVVTGIVIGVVTCVVICIDPAVCVGVGIGSYDIFLVMSTVGHCFLIVRVVSLQCLLLVSLVVLQ